MIWFDVAEYWHIIVISDLMDAFSQEKSTQNAA